MNRENKKCASRGVKERASVRDRELESDSAPPNRIMTQRRMPPLFRDRNMAGLCLLVPRFGSSFPPHQ
jgi:hypothetical protein